MKEFRHILAVLFQFLAAGAVFASSGAVSVPHGLALCRNTEEFLEMSGYAPVRHALTGGRHSDFPYNLTVELPPSSDQNPAEPDSRKTLIIAFTMEDSWKYRKITDKIIEHLDSLKHDYTLILLFSYGDNQTLTFDHHPDGTNVYISEIADDDDCSAVCISFTDSRQAAVIPGSGGDVSPLWLVRRLSSSLASSGIPFIIKGGSLGSLYRLSILEGDDRCAYFMRSSIPCAGILLPSDSDIRAIGKASSFFFSSYSSSGTEIWDRHYIAFHPGTRFFWFSEHFIIVCFISVAFLSLFVLAEFSFSVSKRRIKIRNDVLRFWYILPLTVALAAVSFELSQPLTLFLNKIFSIRLFTQLSIKLVITFVITSLLYLISLRIQGSGEDRSYAYLMTIVSVINIFIFSAVDISMLFLFTAEYLVIYLSRPFKKTYALITEFVIMALPFIPYIRLISSSADSLMLRNAVYSSFSVNILFAFGILPFMLQWLRIISHLYTRWTATGISESSRRMRFSAAYSLFFILIAVSGASVSFYFSRKVSRSRAETESSRHVFTDTDDDMVKCSVTSKTFFGETTRIISVSLGGEAEYCTVTVSGNSAGAVIYSDSPYTTDLRTSASSFDIPSWPPSSMVFSFAADTSVDSTVTVTALYPDTKKNTWIRRSCSVFIPAAGGKTGAGT
jgi:hypothetical protein